MNIFRPIVTNQNMREPKSHICLQNQTKLVDLKEIVAHNGCSGEESFHEKVDNMAFAE
jgi:hypothetical protein